MPLFRKTLATAGVLGREKTVSSQQPQAKGQQLSASSYQNFIETKPRSEHNKSPLMMKKSRC